MSLETKINRQEVSSKYKAKRNLSLYMVTLLGLSGLASFLIPKKVYASPQAPTQLEECFTPVAGGTNTLPDDMKSRLSLRPDIFFPHYAHGGPASNNYTSDVILRNNSSENYHGAMRFGSAQNPKTVNYSFTKRNGSEENNTGNVIGVTIPPGGTCELDIKGNDVNINSDHLAIAAYPESNSIRDKLAGDLRVKNNGVPFTVPPSTLSTESSTSFEYESGRKDGGVAAAYLGTTPGRLTAYINQDGRELQRINDIIVQPGERVVSMLSQMFPNLPPRGSLFLRLVEGDGRIGMLGLKYEVVPVNIGGQTIYFGTWSGGGTSPIAMELDKVRVELEARGIRDRKTLEDLTNFTFGNIQRNSYNGKMVAYLDSAGGAYPVDFSNPNVMNPYRIVRVGGIDTENHSWRDDLRTVTPTAYIAPDAKNAKIVVLGIENDYTREWTASQIEGSPVTLPSRLKTEDDFKWMGFAKDNGYNIKYPNPNIPVIFKNMIGGPDNPLKANLFSFPDWLIKYLNENELKPTFIEGGSLPNSNYGDVRIDGEHIGNAVFRNNYSFIVEFPHSNIPAGQSTTEMLEALYALVNPFDGFGSGGAEPFYFKRKSLSFTKLEDPALFLKTIASSKRELPARFYIRVPQLNN